MKRPTPKEKVAAHLRALGHPVESEDIHHVHGGIHKTLNDTLECWSVSIPRPESFPLLIVSADTLSKCQRGIRLEPNRESTCLYGDLIAVPFPMNANNKWKAGDLFYHPASVNKIRRVHRVKGKVVWFLSNQYGSNPPRGCLQAANVKLGDTNSWIRIDRSLTREACEKCNTPTNYTVNVCGRAAHWCGCK